LEKNISQKDKENISKKVGELKYKPTEVKTQKGNYLVCIGKSEFDIRLIGHMPGIADVFRVSDSFKLVSGKWKVDPTEIDLGDGVKIKEGEFTLMAGPCSIEGEDQIRKILDHLKT